MKKVIKIISFIVLLGEYALLGMDMGNNPGNEKVPVTVPRCRNCSLSHKQGGGCFSS